MNQTDNGQQQQLAAVSVGEPRVKLCKQSVSATIDCQQTQPATSVHPSDHAMTRNDLQTPNDITFDDNHTVSKNSTAARRKRGTKSAATREQQYVKNHISSEGGSGFRHTMGAFPRVEQFNKQKSNIRGKSNSITQYRDENAFGCKFTSTFALLFSCTPPLLKLI